MLPNRVTCCLVRSCNCWVRRCTRCVQSCAARSTGCTDGAVAGLAHLRSTVLLSVCTTLCTACGGIRTISTAAVRAVSRLHGAQERMPGHVDLYQSAMRNSQSGKQLAAPALQAWLRPHACHGRLVPVLCTVWAWKSPHDLHILLCGLPIGIV